LQKELDNRQARIEHTRVLIRKDNNTKKAVLKDFKSFTRGPYSSLISADEFYGFPKTSLGNS
jgi:hypothetical protein